MDTKEQFTELENMASSIFAIASHSNISSSHSHKVGQLSVPQNGTMYLIVDDELYIISPGRAIFIPKNTKHQVYKISKRTMIENIYFTDQYTKGLPNTVAMIHLSELAKVLIARLCQLPNSMQSLQQPQQMLNLLLSELNEESGQNSYTVKIPHNNELRRVFDFLVNSIDTLPSLDTCAKIINISSRTLQRMVKKELNISFILWRQQILFVKALELLDCEHRTSQIAYRLGYNSESAFISMFKKISGGLIPSNFIQSLKGKSNVVYSAS